MQVDAGRWAAFYVAAHDTQRHLHVAGCRASVAQAPVGIDELRRLAAVDFGLVQHRILVQHAFHCNQVVHVAVKGSDYPG